MCFVRSVLQSLNIGGHHAHQPAGWINLSVSSESFMDCSYNDGGNCVLQVHPNHVPAAHTSPLAEHMKCGIQEERKQTMTPLTIWWRFEDWNEPTHMTNSLRKARPFSRRQRQYQTAQRLRMISQNFKVWPGKGRLLLLELSGR
jgi:hypothetical protein